VGQQMSVWTNWICGRDLPPKRWLNSIGAALATPLKPLGAAQTVKPPALPEDNYFSIFRAVALCRAAFCACALSDLLHFPIRIDLNQISPCARARGLLAAVAFGIVSRAFSAAEIPDVSLFAHQFPSSMHAALLLELLFLSFLAGAGDGASSMPFNFSWLFTSK
jgi:hypothetical protein